MPTPPIPFIFEPIRLRSRQRFRSLKHHFFTVEEKRWLCLLILKNPSRKIEKCRMMARRHNLDVIGIEEWIQHLTNGIPLYPGLCKSIDDDPFVDHVFEQVLNWQRSNLRSHEALVAIIGQL